MEYRGNYLFNMAERVGFCPPLIFNIYFQWVTNNRLDQIVTVISYKYSIKPLNYQKHAMLSILLASTSVKQ